MGEAPIQSLIATLETVHEKPFMFMTNSEDAAVNFISGFALAYITFGITSNHRELRREVVTGRGWKWGPKAPWLEMQERGMDNESIMREAAAIEIEILKMI